MPELSWKKKGFCISIITINKIVIKDYINSSPLIFSNQKETMGNVIFNADIYNIARKSLENQNILKIDANFDTSKIYPNKTLKIKNNYCHIFF